MRIERISETQIRCTLDKQDLTERHLKISELAYGGEKARSLFKELMEQASFECDFDAENTPLMIEAIPVSPECLVIVVTKVTDPEELDTRFSSFTSAPDSEKSEPVPHFEDNTTADEIIKCFEHLTELLGERLAAKVMEDGSSDREKSFKEKKPESGKSPRKPEFKVPAGGDLHKVYSFLSLEEVISSAKAVKKLYNGDNTLYKDKEDSLYFLAVHMSDHSAEEFNRVCNIISDYGHAEKLPPAAIAFFDEHFEKIVDHKALQVLNTL